MGEAGAGETGRPEPVRSPERQENPVPRRGAGGSGRGGQEPRRKRGSEQRYAGFGDEIERAFCTQALHALPTAFPVASHSGAATIPRTVVARREHAILLCTYAHCGPHVWPDGEVVFESHEATTLPEGPT